MLGRGHGGGEVNNLIGLCGFAQSGKDTVASILMKKYGYQRFAFADKLKELGRRIDPPIFDSHDNEYRSLAWVLDEYGPEGAKQLLDVRMFYQNLGVGAREVLGKNVWVNAAFADIDAELMVASDTPIVITDVRFKNEIAEIQARGGKLVRINRPGVGPVNGHVSEADWNDAEFDAEINNAQSLQDLEDLVVYMHEVEMFW